MAKSPRTISQYLTYSFVDKDPIIDRMRTIFDDESASYADVNQKSGVSKNTMYQWFHGRTKRPQYATIVAFARSLGYDIQLTKANNVVKLKRTIRRAA